MALHEHLIDGAERQGVSLNQWIVVLLAGQTGFELPEELRITAHEPPTQGANAQ